MIYDLAIIGGGPAGAAAAVYAARKRLRTVLITKDWLGQSSVSESIENWIGTVTIKGTDLSTNLESHVKAYAQGIIDIKEGQGCDLIEKNSNGDFVVKTPRETYEAKTILVTTGSRRRRLEVPGADTYEHKGLTYCASCDGPMYAGEDVAVVGGGNAAFESAAQLLAYCKSVTLLNRSDRFRADPGTVEKVNSHPNMKVLTFAVPKEIKGDKFVTSLIYTDKKNGKDIELPVKGIFVEIGALPNTLFVRDLVAITPAGHIMVDPRNQRASVPGIWAAGDCTDGLYQQNNIAAGDAVKALEDIYVFLRAK